MSIQEKKDLVRRFFVALEMYCQGDDTALDALVSPTYHDRVLGTEGIQQTVGPARALFSNLRCIINELIAEDERVVAHVTFEFTHDQDFLGVPATGKRVQYVNVVALRVAEGRIAERLWNVANAVGVLRQLGAAPF